MKSETKILQNFHGHLGPYLVLGYKAGRYARRKLKHIIEVKVKTYPYPAKSCLLDGLQISTGCTLGRATIKINKVNNPRFYPQITFYKNKQKLTIEFSASIKKWLKRINEKNMKKEAKEILKTPVKKLFNIK